MKILMFTDGLTAGGKERRMIELLKGLSKRKDIDCEVTTMSENVQYPAIFDLDIKIHYLIRKIKKDPLVFYKFYKLCKTVKPDVIHAWGDMPPVYAAPIAFLLKIKLVNGMISDAPPHIKFMSRKWIVSRLTFPFSDMIIGNSKAGLKAYSAPTHKSLCLYNGFDFDRINEKYFISVNKVKENLKINTSKIVGMVAAFGKRKDYDTYLLAAMKVLDIRNDVTFLAIGGGDDVDRCKALIDDKYTTKIIFTGLQENVESLVNTFNIGILSTNADRHGEGISNSIIEYMAISKPVIATDAGGTKEVVIDGKTGFIVPPKDVDAMAGKILQLLDNASLAKEMGLAGRQRVQQHFHLSIMTQQYIDLYRKLLR